MLRIFTLAAALALLAATPRPASAFWPYAGGFGTPWGYNYTYNYGVGYIPPPPYYAVFPPVYYSSQITARHYGASPFAWSGGMEPITYVEQPEPRGTPDPVMIENPFVGQAKATAASKELPTPVKLINPFVANASR